MQENILRPPSEIVYQAELDKLKSLDTHPKPENWLMSPQAVVTFMMGGTLEDGTEIEPKYFGNRRLMEVAVATLVTDRALLLVGIPGTGKTWVAENLSAAISGKSNLLVQGTAGMSEDMLRYSWNYAKLLAEGPSIKALVPSPIIHGMQEGKVVRIEELTRIPSEIQDSLITVLSEKVLPIPELNTEIPAVKGFNIIATANDRDRGVNELSSALQRRFNVVSLPLPKSLEEEINIVKNRVNQLANTVELPEIKTTDAEIQRLITIFRELRNGVTRDGQTKVKSPSGTLSTAEAISVINSGQAIATHFGDGDLKADDIIAGLMGAVIKDPVQDKVVWQEYMETIVKEREDWQDLYRAGKEYEG